MRLFLLLLRCALLRFKFVASGASLRSLSLFFRFVPFYFYAHVPSDAIRRSCLNTQVLNVSSGTNKNVRVVEAKNKPLDATRLREETKPINSNKAEENTKTYICQGCGKAEKGRTKVQVLPGFFACFFSELKTNIELKLQGPNKRRTI